MNNTNLDEAQSAETNGASAGQAERCVIQCCVTEASVHGWKTDFTINTVGENNAIELPGMSPEALIHLIGELAGKELGDIKGMTFQVTV